MVVCLTILLLTAIPTFQELAKAANSIIRLADTLTRELPATLEAIRMTGLELSELSDELNQGAKNAGEAVKQVNESIKGVKQSASSAKIATKSAFAGIRAGLKSLGRPRRPQRSPRPEPLDAYDSDRANAGNLPPNQDSDQDFDAQDFNEQDPIMRPNDRND